VDELVSEVDGEHAAYKVGKGGGAVLCMKIQKPGRD
jgi:hypothetical protein